LILKFTEEKIKVSSIHYKLYAKTKKLSAFKMDYTHGIQAPLMKASDETDDNMQTITLTKKQLIDKVCRKRIDRITLEYQFID
jgi:hypothetical protein